MACLFIGDINPEIKILDFEKKFLELGIGVEKITLKFNKRKKSKMCFFTLNNFNSIKFLITNPLILKNTEYYCQISQSKKEEEEKKNYKVNYLKYKIFQFQKTCVFVNNIPKEMDDITLGNFFSEFGRVQSAFSIKKNSISKGYGFVYLYDQRSADLLIKMKKIPFNGKFMIVKGFKQKFKPEEGNGDSQVLDNSKDYFGAGNHHLNNSLPFFNREILFEENRDFLQNKLNYTKKVYNENSKGFQPRNREYDEPYRIKEFEKKGPKTAIIGLTRLDLIEMNHFERYFNIRLNKVARSRTDQFYINGEQAQTGYYD